MNLGYPLPRRHEIIGKLPEGAPIAMEPIEFQGVRNPYPVYSVSIDLPRYRLKNGRTLAVQEDLLARDPKLPRGLFDDPESDLAQREQHKLLFELSKRGRPLWDEMAKGVQKEPIVLNSAGLIINGNRRLCVMRELLEKDGRKYASYRNVRVVVLPDVDDQQIYEFEVKEQIKPDVKDPYGWIQQAKMLHRGMADLGLDERRLSEIYELPPQRIKELIQLLHAADEYLADRGTPNQYNLVEEDEFSFRKILQGRKKLKSEDDREVFTNLSYLLIDSEPKGVGRLYDAIPDVQENLAPIINAIKTEVNLPSPANPEASEAEQLLGGSRTNLAASISKAAQDPTKRQELIDVITDQIQVARSREHRKENVEYALRRVRAAGAMLLDAKNGLRPDSKTEGLAEQLDSIEKSVAEIRAMLKKRA